MDKTVKILVILFAVVGLGLLGFYLIKQWHTQAVEHAVDREIAACAKRMAQLESDLHDLSEGEGAGGRSTATGPDLESAFGSDKPMTALQAESVDCQKITAQAVAFFRYLDSKGYLAGAGINSRAEELFEEMYQKLAANPPADVGEMENLTNLMHNVTHLYRVLGKDRVSLIKEILKSESAVVEPAMAVLYSWLIVCDTGNQTVKTSSRLGTLYQYSAFFLNTLGGRSYLLRRDSKLRMLINYYALLALDQANDAKLNSYGLDIRPHLDYLFYDISNQKGLLYRQRYLSRLAALKNKYQ
ncbi:MAG: hypothetical protein M0036_13220 [Desulfobacteraceae bacterium]|nr:hypothetical protein [Desulfobacteraceae bacterium]